MKLTTITPFNEVWAQKTIEIYINEQGSMPKWRINPKIYINGLKMALKIR